MRYDFDPLARLDEVAKKIEFHVVHTSNEDLSEALMELLTIAHWDQAAFDAARSRILAGLRGDEGGLG
jgi:hypothetical protein